MKQEFSYFLIFTSHFAVRHRSTANSEVSRELRHAVKTLESKETKAKVNETVTHNSAVADNLQKPDSSRCPAFFL